MRVYHLVFDGSYAEHTTTLMGIGVVDYTDGLVAKVISKPIHRKAHKGRGSSFIAEGFAACAAFEYADPDSEIHIYGDNLDIINLLKNGKTHEKYPELSTLILENVKKHHSVTALHISETDKRLIPYTVFSMAHNASAIASGSAKREYTGNLVGEFKAQKINLKPALDGMKIIDFDKQDIYPINDPRNPKFKF